MKFIHTSDWHIGKRLNGQELLEDQRVIFHRWIEEVATLDPDVVIIAGDLYDRALPSQDAVELVDELFVKMSETFSCPVVVISGNHDNGKRVGYGGYFFERQGIYMAGTPQPQPKKVSVKDADIYLLPFAYPATIRALYQEDTIKTVIDATKRQVETIKSNWDPERLNLLVYHGSVSGQRGEEAGSDVETAGLHHLLSIGTVEFVPVSVFKEFDYVALGHIHRAQQIGEVACYYSGSPMKYAKQEANQPKQYLEVDLTKTHCQVTHHPITPVHDVRIVQGAFHELLQASPCYDYLYFELTDTTPQEEAMSRLRQVYPNAMSLSYVTTMALPDFQEMTTTDETATPKNMTELYRDFYQQMTGEALSPVQEELLTETLATLAQEEREQ
ncbi:MAG: exonuclease SbcCD subunit D [Aerococcus sp.]|nr:exonuclease SbcCD subunit D [Aerococcus sp.]